MGPPPFIRAHISLREGLGESDVALTEKPPIRCLADLIRYNAVKNPKHTFAIQTSLDSAGALALPTSVSFLQFARSVERCCNWIVSNLPSARPARLDENDTVAKSRPVALLLESDLGLWIFLASLLSLQVPVLLLSTRLSPAALHHLCRQTNASSILVSPRTLTAAHASFETEDRRENSPTVVLAAQYGEFLTSETHPPEQDFPWLSACHDLVRDDDTNVIILHSSGTTGMPKPISLAHRYILGYATCHEFPINEDESRRGLNLSTLPLFHGFGALAPCLSLSVGKPVLFPPSSTIPSAQLIIKLLRQYDISSLMTVPSIMEEFTCVQDFNTAATLMSTLEMLVVGGGGLKPSVGELLHSKGITLLNHFGATELGALAPIFRPEADYDHHFLRIRRDLGLRLEYQEEEGPGNDGDGERQCRLIGFPFGWEKPFELQDNLMSNPLKPTSEVKILNRKDDLMVLATGEKVQPTELETALEQVAGIKCAVAFGHGREEIGVLIEPNALETQSDYDLKTSLWGHILEINKSLDGHARVSSKGAIIIKPENKPFIRTDKGSIARKETYSLFEPEINAAYEKLWDERPSIGLGIPFNEDDAKNSLRKMVQSCLPTHVQLMDWSDDEDLIHLGMDSLQASRLRRILSASLEPSHQSVADSLRISAEFIYSHPSVSKLALAICRPDVELSTDVACSMSQLASKYRVPVSPVPSTLPQAVVVPETVSNLTSALPKAVVLLSGSTGTLGTHLLCSLSVNPRIEKIYCLIRSMSTSTATEIQEALKERQQKALADRSIKLPEAAWAKISLIPWQPGADKLGIGQTIYEELVQSVTHIFHGAWPMDFQRKLPSFEPMIKAVKDFILFGLEIRKNSARSSLPKLLVASSIAVVGNYPKKHLACSVPEAIVDDTGGPLPMGYAEAKWVCEKVVQSAYDNLSSDLTSAIVRIGQISGAQTTGFWSPNEHIPFLMKTGRKLGAMPDLQGTHSWIPVDLAALTIQDILLNSAPGHQLVYHLETPVRQSWPDTLTILERQLGLHRIPRIHFPQWLAHLSAIEQAKSLVPFFTEHFVNMSAGNVRLDVCNTLVASKTLRGVGGVTTDILERYVEFLETAGSFE